jgi:hypothetical protein
LINQDFQLEWWDSVQHGIAFFCVQDEVGSLFDEISPMSEEN